MVLGPSDSVRVNWQIWTLQLDPYIPLWSPWKIFFFPFYRNENFCKFNRLTIRSLQNALEQANWESWNQVKKLRLRILRKSVKLERDRNCIKTMFLSLLSLIRAFEDNLESRINFFLREKSKVFDKTQIR